MHDMHSVSKRWDLAAETVNSGWGSHLFCCGRGLRRRGLSRCDGPQGPSTPRLRSNRHAERGGASLQRRRWLQEHAAVQRRLGGDALPAADARDAWRWGGLVCDVPRHVEPLSALDLKCCRALQST